MAASDGLRCREADAFRYQESGDKLMTPITSGLRVEGKYPAAHGEFVDFFGSRIGLVQAGQLFQGQHAGIVRPGLVW